MVSSRYNLQQAEDLTILIADDSPEARTILQAHLQRAGYNTIACATGEEVLQIIGSQNPRVDLAIFDIIMPGIDGITLTAQMRSLSLEHYIPILLLTSLHRPEDIERGLNAGADDYMKKPAHPLELGARVKNILRIRSLEEQISQNYAAIQRDLETAREMQKALLPASPFVGKGVRFAWEYQPSSYVGGDVLNTFAMGDAIYGFYVADVAGHGMTAALLSTWIFHTLKPTFEQGVACYSSTISSSGLPLTAPDALAARLEDDFLAKSIDSYFTLCYCVFDASYGFFHFARCGHPHPILLPKKGTEAEILQEAGGPPIGMNLGVPFSSYARQLNQGDRLYLYSDALVEALYPEPLYCLNQTPTGSIAEPIFFGSERFRLEISSSRHMNLQDQLRYLISRVQEFQGKQDFDDDVSLLAMEVL